jgi:DNA-binding MarR family transcriptional regulator
VSDALVNDWRTLLSRHARTIVALDDALDEFGLGMSEFEVLERLACDCGERPRMQELAGQIHLSQSALSRTVERLEKDGLEMRTM